MIDKILRAAVQGQASDIHLAVGVPPVIRKHGELRRLDTTVLTAEHLAEYVRGLAPEQFQLELQQTGSCNFSLELKGRAFRVNICRERRGHSIVMRLISNTICTPEELGVAKSVIQAAKSRNGLILITGATGSGKSTTLASLLDMLLRTSSIRVVTIEQPIEYRFEHHERSLVTQREVPVHTRDFADAMVDSLRQDPDVLMVGELRTCAEMRVAITAAETGHLVFATLHTSSAPESVDRLVGSFPTDEQNLIRMQLGSALRAVVSQSLVPLKSGNGRVMVHEVLCANAAVSNLIRQAQTNRLESTIQTSAKDGMMMFDDHLEARYRAGLISKETAMTYARNKAALAPKLGSSETE
ncbi:MAG: PilT/PilU family type 4a pilus ATPase [Bdellovibrionales bacterium]|nr:PilT/PilU family type 4a pilus ATPase [Bdellovibrionales bacterium]